VLRQRGFQIVTLPVNEQGLVYLPAVDDRSREERPPNVFTVMLANNETGVIQPIADFARDWRDKICGALREPPQPPTGFFHTDAVQAVGKITVNFRDLGVDAMTVAPHKFHGPLGIGALVVRHGAKLQPQLFGGFQQAGARPGTENVALAVGFHAALKLASEELAQRSARMRSLRDDLEKTLGDKLPEIVIIGQNAPRLPNTSCVSFPGLDRQALVMALDLAGVACSTGSACASGSSETSPTLVAMGLSEAVIRGAIRLSLGAFTTALDIAEAARRIVKVVQHLRQGK
jgi:cysteine desulfurase